MEDAYDVEHYRLRAGDEVLVFRSTREVEEVWADVITGLRAAGWTMGIQRGVGLRRTFAAQAPGPDSVRYYGIGTRVLGGGTLVTIRGRSAREAPERFVPPGACAPLSSPTDPTREAMLRYAPVIDLDLDRDGALDLLLPRAIEDGDGDGMATREETVWDVFVVRGECGHHVGELPYIPREDHFSEVGERGLIDLVVIRQVEGQRVVQRFGFDGERYVEISDGRGAAPR